MPDAVLSKMVLFQNTEMFLNVTINSSKEILAFQKCVTNIPSKCSSLQFVSLFSLFALIALFCFLKVQPRLNLS